MLLQLFFAAFSFACQATELEENWKKTGISRKRNYISLKNGFAVGTKKAHKWREMQQHFWFWFEPCRLNLNLNCSLDYWFINDTLELIKHWTFPKYIKAGPNMKNKLYLILSRTLSVSRANSQKHSRRKEGFLLLCKC